MNNKFTSKDFDAKVSLANSNLKVDLGEEFADLYKLRKSVHDQNLKAMNEEIEGVLGPGGIPIAKQPQIKVQGHRHFHEDQGTPIIQKEKKVLRNVLLRMDKIEGPLATLRHCKDTNTRIKVYTRNHISVRGIATGYVVAFDKYWNLVLRDVDEVFRKKIKYKSPTFDNVEKYVKVADLSITDDNFMIDDEPLVWRNPFRKPEGETPFSTGKPPHDYWTSQPAMATASQLSAIREGRQAEEEEEEEEGFRSEGRRIYGSSSWQDFESCSSRGVSVRAKEDGRGGGGERERKKTEGMKVKRESLKRNTSRSRDFHTLRVETERETGSPAEEAPSQRTPPVAADSSRRRRSISSHEEEEFRGEAALEETKEEKKKKRKRKRKKYEIRERHVKQLLIRGETVALVQVLQL